MSDQNKSWLRGDDHESTKASFPELFFDLVFVFALIQLSATLASDFSFGVASKSLLLVFALWWVWIQTTWITNLLDAETEPVRLLLFGMMFLGIVMAIALPRAFTDMGLVLAVSYSAMQLARSLFAAFAFRGADDDSFRTFVRINIWVALASVMWVAGGMSGNEQRAVLWSLALVVEYLGPVVRYWVPGRGAGPQETLDINGEHFAERCALFVIIALGETILTTGKTASTHIEAPGTVLVLCSAFAGTVLMWWIYFHDSQEKASEKAEHSERPQKTAQYLFTYGHLPIVAGIILTAVGEDFALSHPDGKGEFNHAIALLGGPALFLAGTAWMKSVAAACIPASHLTGIALLGAGALLVPTANNATIQIFATAVLLATAIWEYLAVRDEGRQGPIVQEV
jgi:low temperature requirement protein LtrA